MAGDGPPRDPLDAFVVDVDDGAVVVVVGVGVPDDGVAGLVVGVEDAAADDEGAVDVPGRMPSERGSIGRPGSPGFDGDSSAPGSIARRVDGGGRGGSGAGGTIGAGAVVPSATRSATARARRSVRPAFRPR